MEAETLVPAVAVNGVLLEDVLVCKPEGLQFGVLVPSVVKARASMV